MTSETEDTIVQKKDSRTTESKGQECQQQKQVPTTLSCWKASFADCLLSSKSIDGPCDEEGNGSFILLDNVMDSDASDLGQTKGSGFCENLLQELDVFLDKLKPARTKGDRRADDILQIIQSMGMQLPNPNIESSETTDLSTRGNTGERIRGDKSIFIPRDYRQQTSFAKKCPNLHRLISKTSQTLDREFGSRQNADLQDSIRLDLSMTSVQLAMYPGDSKSGYRRHCDRENACKEEGTDPDAAKRITTQSRSKKPERLITCIYYLTDEDWDASLDGGALRLFHSNDGKSDSKTANSSMNVAERQPLASYTDVIPLRDRMVVFRSDRVPHQVMPSHRRPRLAITIWFYGTLTNIPLKNDTDSNTVHGKKTVENAPNAAHPTPPLPLAQILSTNDMSPSIFVSIASYRDSETRPTIDALYSTALKPNRIFIGVVAQLIEGEKYDDDIWASITNTSNSWPPKPHQLRVIRLHARDATGPCYARGLCQNLYRGEDYVLQIDSHMRFRQNWDEYLVQTIQALQERRRQLSVGDEIEMSHCDKIMLTTYPVGYTLPNNIPKETRGTYLVPWKFDTQGMLRQRGRLVRRDCTDPTSSSDFDTGNRAHRQFLYAGGFNFGPSRLVLDVPYDTMGLHHLFFGEELSMAVRLFTHGYDLYAPEETVCYHLWSRSHRPTQSSMSPASPTRLEKDRQLREMSQTKVKKQLLGDKAMVGAHCGLGEARSAADFANHLGVNFENQKFVREDWDCGELKSKDFVGNRDGNESLFSADSMETKVASLDDKTQALIATFLKGF